MPPLDRYMAARVLRDFEPVEYDYISSIERLMTTIERATKHPRAQELERDNGLLAVRALELQLPFIRESLVIGE